jgi:uncharacterized protein YyaL (SSP411 family)
MKQIILFLSIFFTFLEASNSLINEQSPYLKQHAQNPVSWYAWNTQSLNLAKDENKLIFVSIGYSTCHWCHVMRDESFDDKNIAKALNKDYISIKIDREELPHIDSFYQDIFKKLKDTKNGWPLNFILSPDKELIYISTYIPKSFKYDTEGMDTLIPRLAKEFNHYQLDNIIAVNKNLLNKKVIKDTSLTSSLELAYIKSMEKRFDREFKGFDKGSKFPLSMHLNLLYELSLLKDNPLKNRAFEMFEESLDSMSLGGIFDHVGGGFYRYSVNKDWSLPHFEKMLYTQAELIPLYYKLYKKTKKIKYKNLIVNTIDFLNKNFKTSKGLYFSAMDADSINHMGNKEEGFYYTYNYDEVNDLLVKNKISNSEEILEYLGFDDFGNFNNEMNNIFIKQKLNKPKNLALTFELLKQLRQKKTKAFY